jgi:TusA-related sulfurtransferase
MKVFSLDIHQIATHIEFSTKLMASLNKHMMYSLMKQMDLDQNENLDDVGAVQLRNAMKTMAIGEIKLMEEDDDDSIVVIPSSLTLNEEAHQSQQNDEIEDDRVQDISSHLIPPQASTRDFQIT